MLWQTVEDWELIVVGDGCTDDTAEVVAGFGDPRIRFVNLSENFGEQSRPNSEGARLARGKYLAFLNHDDLWFPDHLERALDGIRQSGADMVYTLEETVNPDGIRLLGATASGRYEPFIEAPASSWLMRREVWAEIGRMRPFHELWCAPTADWLFRCSRAGKDIRVVPWLTVVALQAGNRRDVYPERAIAENEEWFRRMRDEPDFRQTQLAAAAAAGWTRLWEPQTVRRHARSAFRDLLRRLAPRLGVSPHAAVGFFFLRRRGGVVHRARKVRGLPSLERRRKGRA